MKQDQPLDWRLLGQQLLFIAFVIGVPLGIATAPSIFRDGDVSWHLAAGNWILAHGRIPTADPFSFTLQGKPWVATEWLAEIVLASVFKLAGYAGLAALTAAALIGVNAIIFFHLQRRAAALPWVSLLAMNVVLAPLVMARPHVLAWPLLAGWTVLLLSHSEEGQPPPLWSALILVVWTNLHTSFPLAAPIAAAIALDSLIAAQWKTLRQWLIFAFVSLMAICANANGIEGLIKPFQISGLDLLPAIGEWQPTTTHNTPWFFIILLVGLAMLFWRRLRVPIGRLILLLLMLAMAFVHMRHQGTFIIFATCLIPPLFASRSPPRLVPKPLILAALPVLAARACLPLTPPEGPANPRRLIAAVPPDLRTRPVFNGYIFGGPLILAGIKPYIDGRADTYGDQFVLAYVKMARGDVQEFNRAVQRYDIRWTMLPKTEKRLIDAIESSGAWKRVYSDRIGVIDVRQPIGQSVNPDPK